MSVYNERCGAQPKTPGYEPCTRPKGHPGPCAHPEELSLAELLELRGDAFVERDAAGKPTALVLDPSRAPGRRVARAGDDGYVPRRS